MYFHRDTRGYLEGFYSYALIKSHTPLLGRWVRLVPFYTRENWGIAKQKKCKLRPYNRTMNGDKNVENLDYSTFKIYIWNL